jgi:hypothetical protein
MSKKLPSENHLRKSPRVFVCVGPDLLRSPQFPFSLITRGVRRQAGGVGPRAARMHISHTRELIFESFPRIPAVGVEQEEAN